MKGRKTRKPGSINTFLLPYLFILIIPLGFFTYVYYAVIETVTLNAITDQHSMLKQAEESLELRVYEIRNTAMQIGTENAIIDYLYSSSMGTQSYYKVWDIINLLEKHLATNQYVSQIYISDRNQNTVISTSKMHKYGDGTNSIRINNSDDFLKSSLFSFHFGEIQKVKVNDDKISQNTLMFIKTLPEGAKVSYYGNIGIVFDESNLRKMLSFNTSIPGGYNLLLDQNNSIIVSTQGYPEISPDILKGLNDSKGSYEVEIKGEKWRVTYLTSSTYNWKYVSVYPTQKLLAKTFYVKRILTLYLVLTAFFGIVAALFFSFRNAKPFHKLFKLLERFMDTTETDKKPAGQYGLIEQVVEKLIANNSTLAQQNKDQKKITRSAFFKLLLESKPWDPLLIDAMWPQIDPSIRDCSFIGIQFDLRNNYQKETESADSLVFIYAEAVNQALSKASGSTIQYHTQVESNGIFVLVCHPASEQEDIHGAVKSTIELAEAGIKDLNRSGKISGTRLSIGVSAICNDILALYKCNKEAHFAAEYSKLFEYGRPILYETIRQKVNYGKFSVNDHQRLLNMIKSGSRDGSQQVFNEIINANLTEESLNTDTAELLFYGIKSILIEALDFSDDHSLREDVLKARFGETDLLTAFFALESLCLTITDTFQEKKESKNSSIVISIIKYLEEHYSDPSLGIAAVVDRFYISEAHLSKIFKQHTHETFAAYLENLRIKKALSLLKDGTHTVSEISRLTGYNSVESFRRAFKRNVGVAPSEYKSLDDTSSARD